jgi:hypothetical protein
VSRQENSVLLDLQYCMYRMLDRAHVFHCSHHLPEPALHVSYRYCLFRHLSAARFRMSPIISDHALGGFVSTQVRVTFIQCCMTAERERAGLVEDMH